MTKPSAPRGSTRVSAIIRVPREIVYRACLDPDTLASWRVPDGMTGRVHSFEPRRGGTFRMSLTYQDSRHSLGGKTTENTDTFHGRFVEMVPNEKVVEAIEFESADPLFAGELTATTTFADTAEGTEITVLCEGLPPGIRPQDNELGTQQSLRKLAALLERNVPTGTSVDGSTAGRRAPA